MERLVDVHFHTRDRLIRQGVDVAESGFSFPRDLDLVHGDVLKLDLAAHDVTQSFFEGSGAVQTGGRAIRQHFLQAGRSMADAAEEEVIDAQELKSNIP